MGRRKLVAGNWKMNGLAADLAEAQAIAAAANRTAGVDSALCVPATLIERAVRAVPGFAIGGQDVHSNAERRAYRLHLGRDAARLRRPADHRRS